MLHANEDGTHLLLEATSNQVNQDGGYTGMTPAKFREFVEEIAAKVSFDTDHLILGGDHLGPNPWQHLGSSAAMPKACEMVAAYAAAGFSKIHLDASMRCADDPDVLPDEVMAHRAATLCAWAESVCEELDLPPAVYIVGTEVPTPGGASHSLDGLEVTASEAIERTLEIHAEAFRSAGLGSAWERVVGVVVQPGVEFDHDSVVDYVPARAAHLQKFLQAHPELVMEAHSSDYQLPTAYRELVRDGFAILKVGPALTFALREALYALEAIESEIVDEGQRSNLVGTMEATMLAHPANWKKYYHGTESEQRLLRVYSYSDRIRYYWGFPEVQESVNRLIFNLRCFPISDTVLSHFLPLQYAELRQGNLSRDPKDLVIASVRGVLKPYSDACRG